MIISSFFNCRKAALVRAGIINPVDDFLGYVQRGGVEGFPDFLFCKVIVDKRTCKRSGDPQIGGVAFYDHMVVGIAGKSSGAGPVIGLSGPSYFRRDRKGAVGVELDALLDPGEPAVHDLFNAAVACYVKDLPHALHGPGLPAEPGVTARIGVYRRLDIAQTVERACSGRRGQIPALPGVGCAAADRAFGRLEPLIKLKLSFVRYEPIALAIG